MKKLLFLALLPLLSIQQGHSQKIGQLIKNATKKDSATNSSIIDKLSTSIGSNGSIGNLTSSEIGQALKDALSKGAENGSSKLSALNGFFGNAAIKILLPDEAKKVETKLRALGFDKQVDEAILSLNRAAEDAAKKAAPIFISAIKEMSFEDAVAILKGNDNAATTYLQNKTSNALSAAFKPVIEKSLQSVGATKHWQTLFSTYNKLPLVSKVNPDLTAYVTEKALSGVFVQIAEEEKNIRENPVARTTDIMKKVFSAK